MAEIWGAAIAAGGALLSAYSSKKQADEDKADARADAKAATRDEAVYGSIMSQFEREQDDYYTQLGKQRRERGLDQFRQFSSLAQFAPNYTGDNRVQLPEKADMAKQLEAAKASGLIQEQKQAKAKRSLFDKLGNPAGL